MKGRNISVVNDLSVEEQRHLYAIAAKVKEKVDRGVFPEHDARKAAYLLFFEDSTRTKESFRNAAATLNFRTNMFDSANSSINKFETVTDTVRMLCGYTAMQTVFIVRSKIEGLCKALSDSMTEYAERAGVDVPCFVNAGDGRHEHPTQEFLDEFSFLEQLGNSTASIHIALVGDLLLGRTVHSKADGLRIFNKVVVDLVAPPELQLPLAYVSRMRKNGFELNFFNSLDQYFAKTKSVAPILYFTRLQLERMDKSLVEHEDRLRVATSLRMEMLEKLPAKCKIYHPLPRHGQLPEIPFEVDRTEFNGYDQQSRNGYFVRTALLGLITGIYSSPVATEPVPKGVRADVPSQRTEPLPHDSIRDSFFDHADAWIEVDVADAGEYMQKFARMSGLQNGNFISRVEGPRAWHSIPLSAIENTKWVELFFIFFAGCGPKILTKNPGWNLTTLTVSSVENHAGLRCPNTACVSNPESRQRDVAARFHQSQISNRHFSCRFCETEARGVDLFM